MSLFHSSDNSYSLGQIIPVGNWGNKLKEFGIEHESWMREDVLEEVRRGLFPQKPSRWECTFACDNLNTILFYHWKNNPDGFMYEVEIVDPTAEVHKGDFNAIVPLFGYNMWQIAEFYWKYEIKTELSEFPDIECSEILILSPLRVVKIFDASSITAESEAIGLSYSKEK